MKIFSLTLFITLAILFCTTRVNAQSKIQAEKLFIALIAKDCTNARTLAQTVDSVNYKDKNGNTLLTCASYFGCTDVVKLLLDNGATVDLLDANRCTALFLSSQDGHAEIAKLLLDKGAKIELALVNCEQMFSFISLLNVKFLSSTKTDFANEKPLNIIPHIILEWNHLTITDET